MPKNKPYKLGTVGEGASRTPKKVMGSQGAPAKIPVNHFKSKPTKSTSFDSMNSSKPAGKKWNHAND